MRFPSLKEAKALLAHRENLKILGHFSSNTDLCTFNKYPFFSALLAGWDAVASFGRGQGFKIAARSQQNEKQTQRARPRLCETPALFTILLET